MAESIRSVLQEHFAPLALDRLVVLRQEFAAWMHPDALRGIEGIFAEFPDHRFSGARLRGDGLDFRFPNLIEEGESAICMGPAVYTGTDIGAAEPLRSLLRGLWLAQSEGVPFGVLSELEQDHRGKRLRVEIAAPPGEAADRLAARLMRRIRAAAEHAGSFRGKVLAPGQKSHAFDDEQPDFTLAAVDPVRREDLVLAPGVLERGGRGLAQGDFDRAFADIVHLGGRLGAKRSGFAGSVGFVTRP